MTRFAVDAPTALLLLEEGLSAPEGHQLVGTAALRSDVSRSTSWSIAETLGWHDPTDAEILAVARLQADALVTASARLMQAAGELEPPLPVTTPEEFLAALRP
ncbi:hypothetical protein [Galactobacter valiniphilus]|uniref:hypothetical protein n=1 Tax=Galactobacter valiniphilus TaxID=2676122 RepID=UPI0018F627DB|nr:hypothetical protein [Galactobacter valiniphilus]